MRRSESRNNGARCGGEQGYVLIVFLMLTALLVAGAYRILPKIAFEGQRDKEDELIYRGLQYRRAIQLYVRKFGRYPTSLDELQDSNNLRFLRKVYKDPMTEDGEWRLIHIAAGPTFPDALVTPGLVQTTSGGNQPSPTSQQAGGSATGDPQGGGGGLTPRDVQKINPTGANPNPNLVANGGQQQRPNGNPGQQPNAQPTSFGGGGIAGVASKSEKPSIKVVNGQTQYNQWEFIYDYRTDRLGTAAIARVSGAPTQPNPNQPQNQGPPPGSTPRNPFMQQNPFPGIGSGAPGITGGGNMPILPNVPPRVAPAPQQR